MEGISGQRCRCSSRGIDGHGLGSVENSHRHESGGGSSSKRQRCQRHGLFGSVRKTTPYANPIGPPKRILSCAVKRGVPQSLSPGARLGNSARRKSRKDAGNTRGASTRSRSSGKQKLVGTHRVRAPRTAARQVGKGRASPSQTVGSADADGGSSSPTTRDETRGAVRKRAQSAGLDRRGIGTAGVRTKRCAGGKPERHRDGMSFKSVRRREALGPCG